MNYEFIEVENPFVCDKKGKLVFEIPVKYFAIYQKDENSKIIGKIIGIIKMDNDYIYDMEIYLFNNDFINVLKQLFKKFKIDFDYDEKLISLSEEYQTCSRFCRILINFRDHDGKIFGEDIYEIREIRLNDELDFTNYYIKEDHYFGINSDKFIEKYGPELRNFETLGVILNDINSDYFDIFDQNKDLVSNYFDDFRKFSEILKINDSPIYKNIISKIFFQRYHNPSKDPMNVMLSIRKNINEIVLFIKFLKDLKLDHYKSNFYKINIELTINLLEGIINYFDKYEFIIPLTVFYL